MSKIYQKSFPSYKNAGFTLIELLVVVLIIGILAAVALPQYEKAVWKSRNAQLKTAVKSVAQAIEIYALANGGEYPTSFSDLDIDFPLDKPNTSSNTCDLAVRSSDSVRRGKNFEIVLNTLSADSTEAMAVWTEGKYKCNGFSMRLNREKPVYCMEARNSTSTIQPGEFCQKIEQGTDLGTSYSWARYILP